MWLVKRKTLKKIRIVQPGIKTAMIRYFIENQMITLQQKQEALALLQQAHENGYWLACDCISNIQEPPLMYVRRLETGQLSLVRMPTRTAHLLSCPFKFTEKQEDSNPKSSSQLKLWDKALPLNLHRGLETNLASAIRDKNDNESNSTTIRIPRMGRLLYTLLTDASLTQIKSEIPNLGKQFNTIKKLVRQYSLASKIVMSDYFWTFPTQTGFAAIQLKKNKTQWPKSIRPYGIFLLLVNRFENNVAYCQHSSGLIELRLEGNLTFSSGRLGANSGPFLFIVTFTDSTAKSGSFHPMNGFAIPVYSNYLLAPIESHYERCVLRKLIQLVHVFRKRNIRLTIEKPLFDITVHHDQTLADCRPDFLLKTDTKCIVLEVMGSDEDHYLERKIRAHKIMQQLGAFLSFDALQAERLNQWDEKLDELCKKIYPILL